MQWEQLRQSARAHRWGVDLLAVRLHVVAGHRALPDEAVCAAVAAPWTPEQVRGVDPAFVARVCTLADHLEAQQWLVQVAEVSPALLEPEWVAGCVAAGGGGDWLLQVAEAVRVGPQDAMRLAARADTRSPRTRELVRWLLYPLPPASVRTLQAAALEMGKLAFAVARGPLEQDTREFLDTLSDAELQKAVAPLGPPLLPRDQLVRLVLLLVAPRLTPQSLLASLHPAATDLTSPLPSPSTSPPFVSTADFVARLYTAAKLAAWRELAQDLGQTLARVQRGKSRKMARCTVVSLKRRCLGRWAVELTLDHSISSSAWDPVVGDTFWLVEAAADTAELLVTATVVSATPLVVATHGTASFTHVYRPDSGLGNTFRWLASVQHRELATPLWLEPAVLGSGIPAQVLPPAVYRKDWFTYPVLETALGQPLPKQGKRRSGKALVSDVIITSGPDAEATVLPECTLPHSPTLSQAAAVAHAGLHLFTVVGGGPRSGKTSTIPFMVELWQSFGLTVVMGQSAESLDSVLAALDTMGVVRIYSTVPGNVGLVEWHEARLAAWTLRMEAVASAVGAPGVYTDASAAKYLYASHVEPAWRRFVEESAHLEPSAVWTQFPWHALYPEPAGATREAVVHHAASCHRQTVCLLERLVDWNRTRILLREEQQRYMYHAADVVGVLPGTSLETRTFDNVVVDGAGRVCALEVWQLAERASRVVLVTDPVHDGEAAWGKATVEVARETVAVPVSAMDVAGVERRAGHGFQNVAEAERLAQVVHSLVSSGVPPSEIVVLTAEHPQEVLLQEAVAAVASCTIDAFRGNSAPYVVVLVVRTAMVSPRTAAWLNQQLAYATTRATHRCIVLGSKPFVQAVLAPAVDKAAFSRHGE